MRAILCFFFVCFAWTQSGAQSVEPLTVGSKKMTESVIIGEIVARMVESQSVPVIHRRELGGTKILWRALIQGDIDVYPEYTGTIVREIFATKKGLIPSALQPLLDDYGIRMSSPLGFNNTYAVGMRKELAHQLGISKISDLANHLQLRLGFSGEFLDRKDGWPSLRRHYGLAHKDVRGLDHDLALRGLVGGTIDVMDLYSTDAEIQYYDLKALEDDLRFFPAYHAVLLYRKDLQNRNPDATALLMELPGKITDAEMIRMNAQSKIDRVSERQISAEFVSNAFGIKARVHEESMIDRFFRNTKNHFFLVLVSLFSAIVVAIPLGIVASRYRKVGQVILGIVGVFQTIPSLALLVFMIPLLGIGPAPAIAALFLYSLLPIVRNTYTGIRNIPMQVCESADALGLPRYIQLRLIELPMASRTILAGIKTSAVINVGTATLGAIIGAGGYGQPILTGIRLDDIGLILQGAVPAAMMALLVQWFFDWIDRKVVPMGLRIGHQE